MQQTNGRRTCQRAPLERAWIVWALLGLAAIVAPAAASDLPAVELAVSERAPIREEISLNGQLTAPRRARLSSDIEGRIERVQVESGDRVERGQVLLELDRELAELDLEEARAAEREARADLDDARRRLREARELAERETIATTELRAREAEVERQRATLARRESEVARRALLLERHALRAPFAGVVTERLADPGERIEPGTAVYEIAAVDRLRLELMAPQRHFGRIDTSTPVRIRIDALGDETLDARVSEVVPDTDSDSRSFPLRVRLDNSDLRLTPGMSAAARLELDTGREGVLVPRDALIRHSDGRTVVFTADGDGEERSVSERLIEIGNSFGGQVEVTSGLDADTPVVVRGNEALRDGQDVRVSEQR